jgi:hypothetical protein
MSNMPGADKKFRPIPERGCPLASIALQYNNRSAPGMVGVVSHSLTGSEVFEELYESKSSKYLFFDGIGFN